MARTARAARAPRFVALLGFLAVLTAAPELRAERLATLVRGVGAGADKAAGYLSHYLREAFSSDERWEVVDLGATLGSAAHDQAHTAFEVADEMLQKAQTSFQSLDLDAAVEHLNNALSKYESHAAFVTNFSKVANALMLLGATHILRGEERTGARRLAQAIALYPEVKPDPRVFNPGMREVFEQAGKELASRPEGDITLTSNPSYARVYIDGEFLGVTPVRITGITEGRHYVRVVKDGYRPWGKLLDVKGGGETTETANLRPTDNFDDYDSLASEALAAMEGEGDKPVDAVDQLGVLLNLDRLVLTEVRLDGERVNLNISHYNLNKMERVKNVKYSFAYNNNPTTYGSEVDLLYKKHFSPTPSPDGHQDASDAGLQHVGSGLCAGMSCDNFKTLVVSITIATGLAVAGVGGIMWSLAFTDNESFAKTPQLASNFTSMRDDGLLKAVLGDVFFGVGVATALAGTILAFVWDPAPSAGAVVQDAGSFGFSPLFLPGGGGASATVRF